MNFDTSIDPTPSEGEGYLVVHVTTARGAIPLEGALVSVRNYFPSGDDLNKEGDVIATLVSGTDGNTATIPLSAPPRAETMMPSNGRKPYTSYNIEVRLEGYYDQSYFGIPIFDGITAIQPADMIPLPENGQTDGFTPDGTRNFESGSPSL